MAFSIVLRGLGTLPITNMELFTHKRIHELLMTASRPVFVSDERIDGDSLGAALAMVSFMKQQGKFVEVFVAEAVPEQYRSLPHVDHCTTNLSVFENDAIDLVVVFDCSDAAFVSGLVSKIPSSPTVINIDHHKTNSRYGHVNQVLVDAPATAEVVFRFFEANHVIPSKDASTCLLTGLCFDTNAFSNSGTNERALDVASQLILNGARVQDVIRTMFHNRSISALRVWGAALERLADYPTMNLVTTCLTRKDIEDNHVSDDEIDGLSNFLNLVTDTDTLFVLRETKEGGIKVSMRSRTQDVSAIAHAHGGGGHAKAAGFTILNASLLEHESAWCIHHEEEIKQIERVIRFQEFLSPNKMSPNLPKP